MWLALLLACSGSGLDTAWEPIALLEPDRLAWVWAERDPLVEHRPDDVDCPVAAYREEDGSFEVQTGVCDYAAFDQPLPVLLLEGDAVEIIVWHDTLDAAAPATGHVAVTLDAEVIWEATVDIPAESHSFEEVITLDHSPRPDARLGVHLHNHGYNSWRFVAVDRL